MDKHNEVFGATESDLQRSKPSSEQTTIAERTLQVERKTFSIAIQENHLGRFIRIVEKTKSTRSAIIIPESGCKDFAAKLEEMVSGFSRVD